MSRQIQRRETGPFGAFPLRLPVGKLAACFVGTMLIPLWWLVGQSRTPYLKTFYERAYWMSLRDSYRTARDGRTIPAEYHLALIETAEGLALATADDAEGFCDRLRFRQQLVNPRLFHAWLRQSVYHGSALNIYLFFFTAESASFAFLFLMGAQVDSRRRLSAMDGTHRRGTRFVSWKRFNAHELGPLWWLWLLVFWRKQLSSRSSANAIKRGRTLAATPPCYLAAGGKYGQILRRIGFRWPNAEGPGIGIAAGRLARVIISEELLSYHLNIFGGTGRGKSTLMRDLIHQIRERGETFVIHDPKREFYREFYRPGVDWAIDPRLEECPYWAMEDEAADEPEATPWASSFFPRQPRSSPFFIEVPRAIFAYLMSRYSAYNEPEDQATCAKLGYWLANGEREILPRVKGTEHYRSLNRGGATKVEISDQSQGLFSTLGKIAKVLRMMPATSEGRRKFSLKEWKQERSGCIFLCSEPETQEAVLPLHTAIADMAILHTQAEVRDRHVPRVWFVLDEVATMDRISQLENGMTKQRASGNPIILGCHDLPQLEERYGEKGAQTITAQAYTNVVLGTGSEREASHIEKMIGHEEIDRLTENRPWHLMLFNRGHRARSITNQVATTAAVTAAEIQALPRFSGYVLQEGRVLKFKLRPPNRKGGWAEPKPRIIPPLIYREEPEGLPVAAQAEIVCPVDDAPPPPWNFDDYRTDGQDAEGAVAAF